jgi:hypothetical protein
MQRRQRELGCFKRGEFTLKRLSDSPRVTCTLGNTADIWKNDKTAHLVVRGDEHLDLASLRHGREGLGHGGVVVGVGVVQGVVDGRGVAHVLGTLPLRHHVGAAHLGKAGQQAACDYSADSSV